MTHGLLTCIVNKAVLKPSHDLIYIELLSYIASELRNRTQATWPSALSSLISFLTENTLSSLEKQLGNFKVFKGREKSENWLAVFFFFLISHIELFDTLNKVFVLL